MLGLFRCPCSPACRLTLSRCSIVIEKACVKEWIILFMASLFKSVTYRQRFFFFSSLYYKRTSRATNISFSKAWRTFCHSEELELRSTLSEEIATLLWLNPLFTLSEPFQTHRGHFKGALLHFLESFMILPRVTQRSSWGVIFVLWGNYCRPRCQCYPVCGYLSIFSPNGASFSSSDSCHSHESSHGKPANISSPFLAALHII